MSPNFNTPIPAARGITGEGWAAIAGAVGSAFLLAKKLLSPRGGKSELLTRADFYAELVALKDQMHANHLALLEKLDDTHGELLIAVERQAARVNTLEAGFARVDERTRKSSANCANSRE